MNSYLCLVWIIIILLIITIIITIATTINPPQQPYGEISAKKRSVPIT